MRLTQVGCFFLTPKGTADKILDFFLKEEKGFGKVHKGREAEGNRSIHQVLQAGHHGLKELGYPNWRHTLDSLYGGYEEKDEENESDADKRMKSLSERTTIPEASLIRSI